MIDVTHLARQHRELSRRYFLRLSSAGLAAGLWVGPSTGRTTAFAANESPADLSPEQALEQIITQAPYLTLSSKFYNVERGDPLPSELPEETRRAVGLTRDTWQLEVVADTDSGAKIRHPLSKESKTALDFSGLMQLAEKHAVRYLKVMTCNNIDDPLGIGLWEGVPLREVIALARPADLVRRVYYYGYHNDKPEQMFRSSLSIDRVLEDPPGELPVILCYKLNGEWLSPKRGGPVRVIAPEAYGYKSVKWIQRVVLTNDFRANDTYADANNDVESPHKTYARFAHFPKSVKAGQAMPITGVAQVGASGLTKVQYALDPADRELPADDRFFTRLDWRDTEVLAPPRQWGAEFGKEPLPDAPLQFYADGRPRQWPLRHTLAHWAVLAPGVSAGKYALRCRTIDSRGVAQPLPRPMLRSGHNAIQTVEVEVV